MHRSHPIQRDRPLLDLTTIQRRPNRAEVQTLNEAKIRLVIVGIVVILGYTLLGYRLVELGFHWVLGTQPHVIPTKGFVTNRASIIDARGDILATNLKTASLFANPKEIVDLEEIITELPKIIPQLTPQAIRQKLPPEKLARSSFVWLARNLTPSQQADILKLGLPGIQFIVEEKRVYPQGTTAAHVIGFTDIDNNGLSGIERAFNDDLSQRAEPLQLTIDTRIQTAVEDELDAAIKKFQALGGSAVIMDAHSGAIIAMATLPSFDPNLPNRIRRDRLFNPVTLGVYDLGSIMKIFNVASALDSKTTSLKGAYDATHPIKVGRFTIGDYRGGQKRWLSVPEIIVHSSNIGSAKMALDMGSALQKTYMKRFGFLEKVPFDIKELGSPLTPASWSDVTTMTIAYGYGLGISPLHVVRAFAALVNGGYLVRPTLVNPTNTQEKTQILQSTTSKAIRQLTHLVVEYGTAKKSKVPGHFIGAKTGTAEKRNTGGRGFLKTSNITSYLGAFPIYDPKYVIFVMLDEPKGLPSTFGFRSSGWNTAPTAGAIIKRIAPLLDILPVDERDEDLNNRIQKQLAIPNFFPPVNPRPKTRET